MVADLAIRDVDPVAFDAAKAQKMGAILAFHRGQDTVHSEDRCLGTYMCAYLIKIGKADSKVKHTYLFAKSA